MELPGDCNMDGVLDVTGAVCIVSGLFEDGGLPCGDGSPSHAGNRALLDFDPGGREVRGDAYTLLMYLFNGGVPHALGTACIEIPRCPGGPVC